MPFVGLPIINRKQNAIDAQIQANSVLVEDIIADFVHLVDDIEKPTPEQKQESEKQLVQAIKHAMNENISRNVRNVLLVGNGIALFTIAGAPGMVFAASSSLILKCAKERNVPHIEQITGTMVSGMTLTNLALLANIAPIISPIVNLGTAVLASPAAFACAKQALIEANKAIDSQIEKTENSLGKSNMIVAISTKTLLRLIKNCAIQPTGQLAKYCQNLFSAIPTEIGKIILGASRQDQNVVEYSQIASHQDRAIARKSSGNSVNR